MYSINVHGHPDSKGGLELSSTKDNNKKPVDKNAKRMLKNRLKEENREGGKHQYSKDTDHL
ncbi:uncharacterized protein DUF3941 [Bacillus sp. es.036]|nr:uncharacterized protein DUF3941 [Bacillus sp. es.036]